MTSTTTLRPAVGDMVRIKRPRNHAGLTGPVTAKLTGNRGYIWYRIDIGHGWTVDLQADDVEVTRQDAGEE